MKTSYKGFEIEAKRDQSGFELLYFSIFRESDGWEFRSSFTDGDDTEEAMIGYLKGHVDDYLENPQDYDE